MSLPLRFALFAHRARRSPLTSMLRAAATDLGLPHTFEPVEVSDLVRLEGVVSDVRRGPWAGAMITSHYQEAVMRWLDRSDPSAQVLGAADTLVRTHGHLTGYSTQVAGLAEDLAQLGATGPTAAIIGSGTTALAAALACQRLGAKVIVVTSSLWSNSEELVGAETAEPFRLLGALPCAWPQEDEASAGGSKMSAALRLQWPELAGSANIVIDASAIPGQRSASAASAGIVPWERLKKDALAYDLAYTPAETAFLRAARESQVRVAGGLGMLVRQAAHALALWLKVNPNLQSMRLAAERALQAPPP